MVELIVAIMILLIAIGASVGGLTLSYRSTMMGAEKDDAQSLAQRNCDIIMSCITTNIENGKTVDDLFIDPEGNPKFKNSYHYAIRNDTSISAFPSSYDVNQYDEINEIQNTSELVGAADKKSNILWLMLKQEKLM